MNSLRHDQMQIFVSDLYAAIKTREDAHNKTQVFGAIRRAVAVAREYERKKDTYFWNEETCLDRAEGIREAIRAAIGSDKK